MEVSSSSPSTEREREVTTLVSVYISMATTAKEEEEEEETFILFAAAAASTAHPISLFYILFYTFICGCTYISVHQLVICPFRPGF